MRRRKGKISSVSSASSATTPCAYNYDKGWLKIMKVEILGVGWGGGACGEVGGRGEYRWLEGEEGGLIRE